MTSGMVVSRAPGPSLPKNRSRVATRRKALGRLSRPAGLVKLRVVELRGFEPLTFSLRRCALLHLPHVRPLPCVALLAPTSPNLRLGGRRGATAGRRIHWLFSQPQSRHVRARNPARACASTPRQSVPNADPLRGCRETTAASPIRGRWPRRPFRLPDGFTERQAAPVRRNAPSTSSSMFRHTDRDRFSPSSGCPGPSLAGGGSGGLQGSRLRQCPPLGLRPMHASGR